MSRPLRKSAWLYLRDLRDDSFWQKVWSVFDPDTSTLTTFDTEVSTEDDNSLDRFFVSAATVQEVTLSRSFRCQLQTHSQGILIRIPSAEGGIGADFTQTATAPRPRSAPPLEASERSMVFVANGLSAHADWLQALISRSVAAPALEGRLRSRDEGTDFHEPAFFNQLVDFSDSNQDAARNCHTALLGQGGVQELIKQLLHTRSSIQNGMHDTDLTPRDSLAHAHSAILDLHALLKIMEGATSVQPRASDWGNGGLAGTNSDRWAWRRGQQWLQSLLDFIADVETLMEGLLNLQPGPTRGDWYSKGHRLINALRHIEEAVAQGEFREVPSIKAVVSSCNLPAALQPPPPPPLPIHPVRGRSKLGGSGALSSDGSTDGTSQDDTPTLIDGTFKRRYCPLRSQLPYNAYWAKKIAI